MVSKKKKLSLITFIKTNFIAYSIVYIVLCDYMQKMSNVKDQNIFTQLCKHFHIALTLKKS